jgi:integrase
MLGGATRIGEALALRRCDVDLTAAPPTIHICGTIVVRNEKGTYRQPFPKTVTSDHVVAIPEFTANALRASLAMHDDQDPEQLVFLTRRGTPVSPFNVRRSFRQVLQLAGLADQEVKLHTLRKAAAMLVSRHAGDEVAAEMLGHSGTQTLRRHYLAHTREPNPVTAEILERFAPGVSSPALAEITRST